MKFDDLDIEMRVYETTNDRSILPGIFIVARIDGRGFTKLTKKTHAFTAPFDERFRDYMLATTEHLMSCGFDVVYAYTQSDEISLLFDVNEKTFGRKERKFNSILAGEASAKFSVLLGDAAAFDCRLCELPTAKKVVDYFRWRHEDAHRNALGAHCYWLLRKQGKSEQEATQALHGLSTSAKNEFLFLHGINFNDLPNWQKRGTGFYWDQVDRTGINPLTNEEVKTKRWQIVRDLNLPLQTEYDRYLERFVQSRD